KSQTITKINPDNYGFKNEYYTWFGRPDTNHKDRPIMLSEADAKYVWKNSIFRSNTLSIIPWADTEKSGIWQIEISRELLISYIDNYVKNISIKVDNKSVVYNSNNELSVPFDNETIYEENGVWKAKQNSQSSNLHIVIGESKRANADYDKETGGLRIWDPSFQNNDQVADFSVIKTNKTTGLEATDDTLPTTKYINEHYQLKGSGSNDWEIVDTSDFVSFSNKKYKIKNYDSTKYIYKIWIGINENNKKIINIMIETYKNHYEFNLTAGFLPIYITKNGEIISGNNKLMALHVERKKVS
ncbi:hypothetical protein, partial [Spiroplasma phoeniceum]|uniref:hypothetical protein n=1 Tax=Spiroplasma phoeniceum TaxID=47835 RepID=UPI003364CAC8